MTAHRPLADVTRTVTLQAFALEERRNVFGVRDRLGRLNADQAAANQTRGCADGLSRKKLLKRPLEIISGRRRLTTAFGQLIVYCAAIEDFEILCDDGDGFAGPLHAQHLR